MKLNVFDLKQFLIRKGERVALGVAVALMAVMILFSGLSSILRGHSATSNTREIQELTDQASAKMKNSSPPANLGDLPKDLKEAERETIDPDWFACQNLYFDRSGDIDHKWRRPRVLMPDEFEAAVVRGAVPSYMLRKDDDGKLTVALLQRTSNLISDSSKEKFKEEFRSFRKWDNLLTPLTQRGGTQPSSSGAAGGAGAGGRGGRGGAPGMGGRGNFWGRWGRGAFTTSLKWVAEDKLDEQRGMKLAQDMLPVRMVVVSGSFPYRRQLEEFRRALRFDSIDALLNDPLAIPEFLGINVQRREIAASGEPSEWADLDIESAVRQLRIRAVGLVPEDPVLENYGLIIRPNRLVMPRPRLAHDERYPEPRLRGIQQALAALQTSNQGDRPQPPLPKSRFENLDPWSEAQPSVLPAGSDANRGGRGDGAGAIASRRGAIQASAAPTKATPVPAKPIAYTPPEKCLFRFLDVTVEPGKTYAYRVKIKIANPNYGRQNLAVSKEAAADPVLVAPEWCELTRRVGEEEVALRVPVSDELVYYTVDEKLDRAPAANQERAAVQIHRWLDEERINPSDQSSVVPVGEWTVLERLLLHRGEYIGRLQEVELPVWRTALERFALANHEDDQNLPPASQDRRVKPKGVMVDFATDPVSFRPSILVDFEGGKRTFTSDGKDIHEESTVEMLVLNADGKLTVHNSRADAEDRTRRQRYDVWKQEIKSLKDKENTRRSPFDDLFRRSGR
jgi:hypothetical protein